MALTLYARLRDATLDPGNPASIVAESVQVLLADWDLAPDGTEQPAAFGFAYNDPVGAAAVAASGGANLAGPTLPRVLEISLDGALYPASKGAIQIDYRMLVDNVVRGLYVEVRGRPLYGAYGDAAVDRLTLNSTLLVDALGAAVGTITPLSTGNATPGYLFAGNPLPQQKGVFQTVPGAAAAASLFQMYPVLSAMLNAARVRVDADSDTNFLDKTAAEFLAVTEGVPLGPAPLGSYSHLVADSSDAGLNLTGQKQGVAVGYLGISPHLTFARTVSASSMSTALIDEGADIAAPLTLTSDMTRQVKKIAAIGGYSNHGLPDGATIYQGICILSPTSGTSTNWSDNLFVFVACTSAGLGGAYFWAHDGLAYRIGQEIDGAKSICSDGTSLYAGGLYGVFSKPIAADQGAWTRVGGLDAEVKEVRFCGLGVVAWVKDSTGQEGLYLWSGSAKGGTQGSGYDGWTALSTNGAIQAWGAINAGGAPWLLVVPTSNPSTITCIPNPTKPAAGQTSQVLTLSAHVSGIDSEASGTVAIVRTDAGAAGLYEVSADPTSGAPAIAPLGGDSLRDSDDNLVQVNRVIIVPLGATLAIDVGDTRSTRLRATYYLVACTDNGLYFCPNKQGNGWVATPPQSGLANQSIVDVAIGTPQTLINRVTTRIYAMATNGLYVSHSAGFWFDVESEDKVSIGGYLTALARLGGSSFLDNTNTAVGVVAGGGGSSLTPNSPGLETSGNTLLIGTNQASPLPAGYYWTRPLNERNKWTYRLVNANSKSLTGKIVPAEFIAIQADSTTPAAVASGKLAQAMLRKALDSAVREDSVVVRSRIAFAAHALRTLRPGHLVSVAYDRSAHLGLNLSGVSWYVVRHRFTKQLTDPVLATETTLSTVFRTTDPSDSAIGDALAESLGKVQRQGKIR